EFRVLHYSTGTLGSEPTKSFDQEAIEVTQGSIMGFIQAFTGSIGGMFADQWLDFLLPPENLAPTAALFPAVAKGQNAGRGSNTRGSENIITHGSKIIVPEGYALLTFQDGQ